MCSFFQNVDPYPALRTFVGVKCLFVANGSNKVPICLKILLMAFSLRSLFWVALGGLDTSFSLVVPSAFFFIPPLLSRVFFFLPNHAEEEGIFLQTRLKKSFIPSSQQLLRDAKISRSNLVRFWQESCENLARIWQESGENLARI